MKAPIRLLLAEDHALVRAGIRSLLVSVPGITVVGEAGDGREALAILERTRPTSRSWTSRCRA